jgi:hypothetical protein
MLKGLFSTSFSPIQLNIVQELINSTITYLQLYSTLTWVVPPNYTGIYQDFSNIVWYSGLNFGSWDSRNFFWYGKVITTVVISGNTSGTINFYRLTWTGSRSNTSTVIVLTWSGTINNVLTLSYSDDQPYWYGALAYYFNLANTVTAVIYYNFNSYYVFNFANNIIGTANITINGSTQNTITMSCSLNTPLQQVITPYVSVFNVGVIMTTNISYMVIHT